MIWIWDPLWMRQLLRKMKEFRLRAGKLRIGCWISGHSYWIQGWQSALLEPIFNAYAKHLTDHKVKIVEDNVEKTITINT